MVKNYLTIAARHLAHRWGFTLLNVLGLAIGFACAILIAEVVRFEMSYESFHQDANRIFRVNQINTVEKDKSYGTGPLLGPYLQKDLAEVEQYAQLAFSDVLVSYQPSVSQGVRFQESVGFINPAFFELFTYEFMEGDPATALDEPASVVLTQSAAQKFFGSQPALGKVLLLNNRQEVTISGVIRDLPANSDIRFDYLAPVDMLRQLMGVAAFESWWWPSFDTYVKLSNPAAAEPLNTRLQDFILQYRDSSEMAIALPQLQPLTDVHLYGINEGEGTIRYVYIFSLIAAFIILIACVNFMNLSTAQAGKRAKEVGLRKVIGASRPELIGQFLSESMLITMIALGLGILLAEMATPLFNQLSGYPLALSVDRPFFWWGLLVVLILTGGLAGSYPAFFLSRFMPIQTLKGGHTLKIGGANVRKGLVVVQFAIAIVLVASTLVVFQQLQYMRSKALGFDTEKVVALPTYGAASVTQGYETFRDALLPSKDVLGVTASSWIPGNQTSFKFPMVMREKTIVPEAIIYVDYNFLDMMQIKVVEGRSFSKDFAADRKEAFILNRQAVHTFDLDKPLNEKVRITYGEYGKTLYDKRGEVVGVVDDFHLFDLKNAVGPAVLTVSDSSNYYQYYLVRLGAGNLESQTKALATTWNTYFPDRPFEPLFLDDRLAAAYAQEQRLGQMAGLFTGLALLIAGLGLLGLSAFMTEQRTKEIGVRKVLGATTRSILLLVSKEFTVLVLVAFVLALPVAWFLMHWWLQDFAYRVDLSIWVFLLSGALALLVAWLTVGYQSVKAALANPVESLRSE